MNQQTLQSLIKLASLISTDDATQHQPDKAAITGQHIVVLDRGFVYVGNVARTADFFKLSDAKNIRRWGTINGLGELVNGPLSETILDPCGEVLIPEKSIIHMIPCKGF